MFVELVAQHPGRPGKSSRRASRQSATTLAKPKRIHHTEAIGQAFLYQLLATVGVAARDVTQATPPHYRTGAHGIANLGNLKADAYYSPHQSIVGIRLGLALRAEFNGGQHRDPNHPFNLQRDRKNGWPPGTSWAIQVAVDAYKRLERVGEVLLWFDTNDEDRRAIPGMIQRLAALIEKRLPDIAATEAFRELVRNAQTKAWINAALADARPSIESVQAKLDAAGRQINVLDYDAESERYKFQCRLHLHWIWNPSRRNVTTDQAGCKLCQAEAHSKRRILPYDELCKRAAAIGLRPDFDSSAYKNNQIILPWTCLAPLCGEALHDSWAHLETRGCQHCRKDGRDELRCAIEYRRVRDAVEGAGHALVSSPEQYVTQDSVMEFRCGKCGQSHWRPAVKLLSGLLGCALVPRIAAARDVRRESARRLLMEAVDGLGARIVKPFTLSRLRATRVTVAGPRWPVQKEMSAHAIVQLYRAATRQ